MTPATVLRARIQSSASRYSSVSQIVEPTCHADMPPASSEMDETMNHPPATTSRAPGPPPTQDLRTRATRQPDRHRGTRGHDELSDGADPRTRAWSGKFRGMTEPARRVADRPAAVRSEGLSLRDFDRLLREWQRRATIHLVVFNRAANRSGRWNIVLSWATLALIALVGTGVFASLQHSVGLAARIVVGAVGGYCSDSGGHARGRATS
jgi:hypothetical protein